MKMRRIMTALTALCLLLTLAAPSLADYRYDESEKTITAQAAYAVATTVNGRQLDVGAFKAPSDLYVDDVNQLIYLLDAGNSRIVILDRDLKAVRVMDSFTLDGAAQSIVGAKGLFVDTDGLIYIADTANLRVLVTDGQGVISRVITRPDSGLFDDSIKFIPRNVIVDKVGIMYVVSENCTQGAFMIDKGGNFLGFYGRNEIDVTARVIYEAMLREFATEKQRAGMSNFIPVEYANFDIDQDGFIYTVTAYADQPKSFEMIRKLNPLGENVLSNQYRSWGDEPEGPNYRTAYNDVVVDGDGFIFALDPYWGRVFQYDNLGFQIAIFGGKGNQAGLFSAAVAIEVLGDRILVLDSAKNNLTVFKETEFGSLLRQGMVLYNEGRLEEALVPFEELLRMDANMFFAYYALADTYYEMGDYEKAAEYAEQTELAAEVYSKAKKEIRNEWMRENFALIFFGVIGGALVLMVILKVVSHERQEKSRRSTPGEVQK